MNQNLKRPTAIRSAILGLLLPRSPTAVARLVIAVVVNALDCMERRRALAHIGKECTESLSPAFANRDPAPSVPTPSLAIGFVAALNHCYPHRIFRYVRQAMLLRFSDQGIALSPPALVVHTAIPTKNYGSLAAINGAGVNLGLHRVLLLLGVMGPDVSASRPFYFTSICI